VEGAVGRAEGTIGSELSVRKSSEAHVGAEKVRYRDLWGTNKHAQLLETAHQENGEGLFYEVG
jgi:hypothetical protein